MWVCVQAARNLKKRKGVSQLPSLPRSRNLAVPSEAAAAGEGPRWSPLRMLRGGNGQSSDSSSNIKEADKQEST